jgi:hypothetical protein
MLDRSLFKVNTHTLFIIPFLVITSIRAQNYQEIVDIRETKEVTHYITGSRGNYIVSDAIKKSSISYLKSSLNDRKAEKTYYGGYALLLLYKDNSIENRASVHILGQSKRTLMYPVKEQEVKTKNYSRVGIKRLNSSPDDKRVSLTATRKLLQKHKFPYISLFCVRSKSLQRDVIAALVKYGISKKHYAVYGVWKNDKEAKKYGYKAGDRIYMSAPTSVKSIPDTNGIVKKIIDMGVMDKGNGETFNILVNEVTGAKHWTYEEVIKNKETIFDQLHWNEYPLNSEMPVKYDLDGIVIKDKNGNVPPPGPDSYGTTTNPPPTNNCPDMETYFDLYCQCVKPILDTEYREEKSSVANYANYNDYLGKTLMEEDWDGTIYNEDGMVGSQEASTEFQPEQPYLFDKNCNLINKNMPKMYDPFKHKLALINVTWGHIKGFRFGHIAHTRDLTGNIRPVLNDVIQFYETYLRHDPRSHVGVKHPHGSIEINDEKYLNENLYIGNPVDKYRPYEKPEFFVIFDNHYASDGKPLRTEVKYKKGDHAVKADNDRKDWYIVWSWPVVYKDKFGIKRIAGTVRYKQHIYRESGKLEKRGQKFELDHFKDKPTESVIGKNKNHRCNTHIYIIGTGEAEKFTMSSYNENSKDYYTDQYDISERDPDIEKNEALQEIILKIAVAEGLNLVMKGLYKLAEKKKQAIPLYEAGKRLENKLTQSRTYKIAKELYRTYATWKTTMDLLKECRDTYRSIGQAWDGLMYSMFSLKEYYKNMDYKKVRLTNISCVLPMRHLKSIDADLYTLHTSINDFQLAIDAMAFQSDMIVKGHYGPLKPIIFVVTQSIKDIKLSSGVSTTEIIKSNTKRLNNITQNTGETASEACYLSNVTATIQTLTAINRETLVNDRIKAMGCALLLAETESRDWMEYTNFMQSMPQSFKSDITSGEFKKAPLSSIIRSTYHREIFSKENELVLKKNAENR